MTCGFGMDSGIFNFAQTVHLCVCFIVVVTTNSDYFLKQD